jgi:hypothetical protein
MPSAHDLLDATASVDWAVSNFPSFEARLNGWLKANLDLVVKNLPSNAGKDGLILVQKEPIPRLLNAEVGAYINSIRTSLDVLATAIARRDNFTLGDNIYFPVASSQEVFERREFKGKEFFKALSTKHRAIIESVKPYPQGNNALWTLHKLDVTRKHKRLLTVRADADSLTYTGGNRELIFFGDVPGTRTKRLSENEILLAYVGPGSKNPEMQFAADIVFDEAPLLEGLRVTTMLEFFAQNAKAIIDAFDF